MVSYSYALRKWSYIVRIRDGCVCRLCKNKFPSYDCHAHHVNPKEEFPLESLKLSNGITLCKSCHIRITHSCASNVRQFKLLYSPYLNRLEVKAFNNKWQFKLDRFGDIESILEADARNNG